MIQSYRSNYGELSIHPMGYQGKYTFEK
jgi:hypothetical protein